MREGKKMMSKGQKLGRVHVRQADDWVSIYVDGKKVHGSHRPGIGDWADVLNILGVSFSSEDFYEEDDSDVYLAMEEEQVSEPHPDADRGSFEFLDSA